MKGNAPLLAFNRGLISPLALARVDLERTALSAAEMTNWMPRALGSMMLRPGLGYTGSTRNNAKAKTIPFVFSSSDTALIEITTGKLRVRVNDALITRATVTATVANGDFSLNLSSWTNADEAGGASAWELGGYMSLRGNGSDSGIRQQEITVNETGVEHAVRIIVTRGVVTLRIGSTAGAADYISDTSLGVGIHSIALTPSANFHIQLSNSSQNAALVDSVSIEAAGVLELDAPWLEEDLQYIRYDQSGDVIFIACEGYQQRRIERRSLTSWSIVLYQPVDGPFLTQNTTSKLITPSALTGNITLTASGPVFKSSNVGSLFSITSVGQLVDTTLTGDNQFTESIRVTGIDASRSFTIEVTGTFVATVTVQRSIGVEGAWEDFTTYTAPISGPYDDELDNQIIYYRLGIKTGNYTSGTVDIKLIYTLGSRTGIVRVTAVSNETSAEAEVLSTLGGTTATDTWSEGAWSNRRGWPSAVKFYGGRLWWAGKDRFWGSITDSFDGFDPEFEGDAGPISRSIGSGPVDVINWLFDGDRLMAGTDGAEISCRSSSLDEPLSPTNFDPKATSTQGSANVAAVKVDNSCLFVQRCGKRLYQLDDANNYQPVDLTSLVPDVGESGIISLTVQRQPDTRVHCVRSDGKVAVMVFDPLESVKCWTMVETDGVVEDVIVLPGVEEDRVYYLVKRTIDGNTVRYLEKWALESEARGGAINKMADSFLFFAGPVTTASGLSHLNGKTVVVWGNSKYLGEYTVSSGSVTLSESATNVVIGLPYTARFKSTKLAYFSEQNSTALTQKKRVNSLALIMSDVHPHGIQYGPSFDQLDRLPLIEDGALVDADTIWDEYDKAAFEFGGSWESDPRLCLQATAPYPVTLLAAVLGISTSDKF